MHKNTKRARSVWHRMARTIHSSGGQRRALSGPYRLLFIIKSEIVVPVKAGDRIVAVLDIDSEHLDTFDDTDRAWLEQIAELIAPAIS